MANDEQPQIYLTTPPAFELSSFPTVLAQCLDAVEIGCVKLALSSREEDVISRAADACREVCHARDVALVIDSHVQLVERLGLDGVHLVDGARSVRKTRKALGDDAIIGTFCGASRHDGMTAGEAGADYVSFGPVGESPLGDGTRAELELFQWWSQIIEVPVVAEGALDETLLQTLAPVVDFIGLGDEVWTEEPVERLRALAAWMRN